MLFIQLRNEISSRDEKVTGEDYEYNGHNFSYDSTG
jgi:hypothetical protein